MTHSLLRELTNCSPTHSLTLGLRRRLTPAHMAGVKDAVVDAVEELYLKAAAGGVLDPRQAAHNLVALAQGSSLGQSLHPRPIFCAHRARVAFTGCAVTWSQLCS